MLSEENLIGTMERNIATRSLYPDIERKLALNTRHFERVSRILLSIRHIGDWWRSALLFSSGRSLSFPDSVTLQEITADPRTWVNIVDELREGFPQASIIVREAGWKSGNQKAFFKFGTGLKAFDECKNIKRRHNVAPSIEKLKKRYLDRADLKSLERLENCANLDLFTAEQYEVMDERYRGDLALLRDRRDITFLEGDETPSTLKSERMVETSGRSQLSLSQPTTCILRMGKGGAGHLRKALGAKNVTASGVRMCRHDETLVSTRKMSVDRRLVLIFRDPIERFCDAFASRLAQGHPEYHAPWSNEEAIAFSFFGSANDLAEALTSDDQRLKSASRYAISNITHLRHSYEFYLQSSEMLKYEHEQGNILVCCEYKNTLTHLDRISETLGISATADVSEMSHSMVTTDLSKLAQQNLNHELANDVRIYQACKEIANAMGFDSVATDGS